MRLIEYRDVRVDGDDGPIVTGFSAAAPAGRLTVMVGPSGAGKTTLLRLLNRLDDPDAGAVLFAGRDVRSYDVLDLRRRVQLVGQVPVTFPGTVADNLAVVAAAGAGDRGGHGGGMDVGGLLRPGRSRPGAGRPGGRPALGRRGAAALRWPGRWPSTRRSSPSTSRPRPSTPPARPGSSALIRALADSGLTVVMVTHDPAHADLADHVVRVEPYSPDRRP